MVALNHCKPNYSARRENGQNRGTKLVQYLVTIMKIKLSLESEYSTAVLMLVVVDMGASSVPACGGIRQHTSAYVSIRQHTSAYVSILQHTSAYVSASSVPASAVR